MAADSSQTEALLDRAQKGDESAVQRLFTLYRGRLKRMVAFRMDARLVGRLDPSDLIQEASLEAARKLPEYLERRNCPFYPWLRQITWEKLVQAHRRHVYARRRSVTREAIPEMQLSNDSLLQLAASVSASQSSPSQQAVQREVRHRVRAALARLAAKDREILVFRHLEQLKLKEIAVVLGISSTAAQSRYRRAVERLHEELGDDSPRGDR